MMMPKGIMVFQERAQLTLVTSEGTIEAVLAVFFPSICLLFCFGYSLTFLFRLQRKVLVVNHLQVLLSILITLHLTLSHNHYTKEIFNFTILFNFTSKFSLSSISVFFLWYCLGVQMIDLPNICIVSYLHAFLQRH